MSVHSGAWATCWAVFTWEKLATACTGVTGCLHNARATFAPHFPVPFLCAVFVYMMPPNCHQTYMPVRVNPALVHPSQYTGARISLRCEISQRHSCKRIESHEGIEVNTHPVIWPPLHHVDILVEKENAMLWLWSCGLFSVLFIFRKFQE